MTDLAMSSPFAAGAGRARAVNDEGVPYVGFGVGEVLKEAFAKSEDDLLGVYMTKTVAVVKMVSSSPLALTFGENQGRAINVGDVRDGVEVLEVAEESGDRKGEGPFWVGGEDEWGSTGFREVVVAIGPGVAGNAVSRAQDGVFGKEIPGELRVVAATPQVADVSGGLRGESSGNTASDARGEGVFAEVESDAGVADNVKIRTVVWVDDIV